MQSKYWTKSGPKKGAFAFITTYSVKDDEQQGDNSCLRSIHMENGNTFFSLKLNLKSSCGNAEYEKKYTEILELY